MFMLYAFTYNKHHGWNSIMQSIATTLTGLNLTAHEH